MWAAALRMAKTVNKAEDTSDGKLVRICTSYCILHEKFVCHPAQIHTTGQATSPGPVEDKELGAITPGKALVLRCVSDAMSLLMSVHSY